MSDRPILFSGSMVRAILNGSKTQTRRVVKPQPLMRDGEPMWPAGATPPRGRGFEDCPYGKAGDRLWVRETFRIGEDLGAGWEPWMSTGDRFVAYIDQAADEYCVPDDYVIPRNAREVHNSEGTDEHWRSFGPIPSIHMPRWASRITLEITGVRVERLHDISEADARAEGVEPMATHDRPGAIATCYGAYRLLWDAINGPGAWDANPWVWCISFRRVDAS